MPNYDEQLDALRREVEALKQRDQRRRTRWLLSIAAVALVAGTALAQPTLTPFVADAPARATQVNANFTQLAAYSVPPGAIAFFETATCPTGWSAATALQGRAVVARPGNGTVLTAFGTAMSGNTSPSHAHTTQNAGTHSHSGNTGNWAGWRTTTINYSAVPGYVSPYHIVSNLEIANAGDHSHGVNGTSAAAVIPYLYLTACKKD